MAVWNTYIDDSHSGGRIVDADFQPIPTSLSGFTPCSGVGSITIRATKEHKVLKELNRIRKTIQKELLLSDLPVLHMRQMWGKNPPKDKGKNPFRVAPMELRFFWIRQLAEMLSDLSHDGIVYMMGTGMRIEVQQEDFISIFSASDNQKEVLILEREFPGFIQKFYDLLFNPLPGMILKNLAAVNDFCYQRRDAFNATYDVTQGSKGIGVSTAFEFIRKERNFQKLLMLSEGNTRDQPLLQLADFASYFLQRQRTAVYTKTPDLGVGQLLSGTDIQFLPMGEYMHEELGHKASVSAFTVGFAFDLLRNENPEWVDKYAIPLDEIYRIGVELDRPAHLLNAQAIEDLWIGE